MKHSITLPVKTYIKQFCADIRCRLEGLTSVMAKRDG